MTFKRVVIVFSVLLMLTGIFVSATVSREIQTVEETTRPFVSEATKKKNATTQTPVIFDVDDKFNFKNANSDEGKTRLSTAMPTTSMQVTMMQTTKAQKTIVVATNPIDRIEKPTEKALEDEPTTTAKPTGKSEKQKAKAKPLEEGTIVDPSIDESTIVLENYTWKGEVLNSYNGTVQGPNGKETYYNLRMSGVISIMENMGYNYEYHVREDGVKMYGPFIMVAADLNLRPRGSIIKTSLGWAMVCDTGTFALSNPTQLDIATAW